MGVMEVHVNGCSGDGTYVVEYGRVSVAGRGMRGALIDF